MFWIREVTGETVLQDLPHVARVHFESWLTTYPGIVPQSFLDGLSYEGHLERWMRPERSGNIGKARSLFVAQLEMGEIVGFADGGAERHQDAKFDAELYALYILKPHQGLGIGRALLERVKSRLLEQDYKTMLIWALEKNPACAFYEAMGGERLRTQTIEIAGEHLPEIGFVWRLK